MVVEEIVAEADKSLSVVADESCHISRKKLSIVSRYTLEMSSVSAESSFAAIPAHRFRTGINLRKLVGQSYEEASTMASHVRGIQRRIRDI